MSTYIVLYIMVIWITIVISITLLGYDIGEELAVMRP